MSTSEGPPARNTRAAHKARHRQAREDQPVKNIADSNTQGPMTPSALSSVPTRARSQSATPAPGRRRSSAPAQNFSTALPGESNVPSAAGTAGEQAEERISPDHALIETSILSFEPELVYTTTPIDTYPSEEGTSFQPRWDKGKRRARDVMSQDEELSSSGSDEPSVSCGKRRGKKWTTLDERLAHMEQASANTRYELADLRSQIA
ncbi:hypothetical protein BC826DRAFT_975191, partial [Russula brevipes]